MVPSWRLTCLIAVIISPALFRAVFSKQMSVRQLPGPDTARQQPRKLAESPVIREYFYVGGRYVDDGSGQGQHVFVEQMYVEKLSPTIGIQQPCPLVFIHGQGQTGTNWLNKPDGSPGWASYFTSKGYTLYIVDQTFRGRSPWNVSEDTAATFSAEIVEQRFTAPERFRLWPQAVLHTQWPGSGVRGDKIFDTYYASTVPYITSATQQQSTVQTAGVSLLDQIGRPVILLGHSQGGMLPFLIADARPELSKAIVVLEPSGPPFGNAVFGNESTRAFGLTDVPMRYEPPVDTAEVGLVKQRVSAPSKGTVDCIVQANDPEPRQLVNLQSIPVLLVTAEASYHAPYDWCTVKYLQQAGVNVTHLELGKVGIHGNGHLFFLEKNSDEIADVVEQWISDRGCG